MSAVAVSDNGEVLSGDIRGNVAIWPLAQNQICCMLSATTNTGHPVVCAQIDREPGPNALCVVGQRDGNLRVARLSDGELKGHWNVGDSYNLTRIETIRKAWFQKSGFIGSIPHLSSALNRLKHLS